MIGAVTTSGSLGAQARRAADSSALEMVARAGYAVSGLLHLLIGGIAVRLATGSGGQSADQSGALAQVAAQPFGRVVLWIGVVGFAALGLSQLGEAVWGGGGGDRTDRTKQVGKTGGKAVVYLALSGSTLSFARGTSSSSSKQSSDVTATLLQSSGGRVLVTAIGLAVVGVGGYHMVKGVRKKFLADLAGNAGGDVGRGRPDWAGRLPGQGRSTDRGGCAVRGGRGPVRPVAGERAGRCVDDPRPSAGWSGRPRAGGDRVRRLWPVLLRPRPLRTDMITSNRGALLQDRRLAQGYRRG